MSEWSPTPYEREVLREARESFRNPLRTPLSAMSHAIAKRGDDGDVDRDVLEMIATGAAGGLAALTALAAATLRERAVWRAYRRAGIAVTSARDVEQLALWEIDEAAEPLRAKYAALAIGAGAVAGTVGGAGIALDAPIALVIAMRAILEHATHYGFDPSREEEQAFAMQVLIASLVPSVEAHEAGLDALARSLASLARAWKKRTRGAFALPLVVHVLRRLLRRDAGTRIVRRLASLGAAAANAWLVLGVIETAQAAYRRRFLARARAHALAARPVEDDDARAASE